MCVICVGLIFSSSAAVPPKDDAMAPPPWSGTPPVARRLDMPRSLRLLSPLASYGNTVTNPSRGITHECSIQHGTQCHCLFVRGRAICKRVHRFAGHTGV